MALGVASPWRSRFEPSARTQEGAEAEDGDPRSAGGRPGQLGSVRRGNLGFRRRAGQGEGADRRAGASGWSSTIGPRFFSQGLATCQVFARSVHLERVNPNQSPGPKMSTDTTISVSPILPVRRNISNSDGKTKATASNTPILTNHPRQVWTQSNNLRFLRSSSTSQPRNTRLLTLFFCASLRTTSRRTTTNPNNASGIRAVLAMSFTAADPLSDDSGKQYHRCSSTPNPPHVWRAPGCSPCSRRADVGTVGPAGVLSDGLHLLGERVAALLHGLALGAVLDGV